MSYLTDKIVSFPEATLAPSLAPGGAKFRWMNLTNIFSSLCTCPTVPPPVPTKCLEVLVAGWQWLGSPMAQPVFPGVPAPMSCLEVQGDTFPPAVNSFLEPFTKMAAFKQFFSKALTQFSLRQWKKVVRESPGKARPGDT